MRCVHPIDLRSACADLYFYELTPNNRQRELNGLKAAMEKFSIPKGIIISYDQEKKLMKTALPYHSGSFLAMLKTSIKTNTKRCGYGYTFSKPAR